MEESIDELARLVTYHQDRYYNSTPEISDEEFDALWDRLREAAPDHELFRTVGADSSDAFEKREHLMPMNSQDKAATPDAFRKWAKKSGHPQFIVQYKLDGASIELQYDHGVFAHGVTRGDGRIGDDITANVSRMGGVPKRLPERYSGAVRGEIIMTREVHRTHYADKANCRNAANGLMRRKDGAGSEHLTIFCYDAVSTDPTVVDFQEETDKLHWLERAGFTVVPYFEVSSPEEVIALREDIIHQRSALPYDIDGLVVKGPYVDHLDMQRARPTKQIAFKFSAEEAVTVLHGVEWSESGHLYTPVALLDPVQLAGTTVRRASLVHPELIEELGVRIGCTVVVTKRGDIIPKIERVTDPGKDASLDASRIVPPSRCSTCGTEVVCEPKRVYCPNPVCPRRAFHRIVKWLAVLEVRDFGEVLLRKAFDAGLVQEIADLYRLTIEDLAQFPGAGETSARKALSNLHEVSRLPLARFLAGFDISGIAELKIARMVHQGFTTLEALRNATVDDLAAADGVAHITAEAFSRGLAAVWDQVQRLLATGAVEITTEESREAPLAGLSFCFTGTLHTMKRGEAERLVRDAGGETRTSVTAGLSHVVTNDPHGSSSKLTNARKFGISIISEDQFLALLEGAVTRG